MNPAYLGLVFVAAPFMVACFVNWDISTTDYKPEAIRNRARKTAWICGVIGGIHLAPLIFGLWTKAILG